MALPSIHPLNPTLTTAPFHRPGWVYEEKYDGWRIIAYKDGPRVRLVSRAGRDHAARFRDVAAAVASLPASTLILDGEVCAFDAKPVSHLQLLHDAGAELATPPVFVAFDCLYARGRDLRREPLTIRRQALEEEILGTDVLLARRLAHDGLEAWEDIKQRGCEGLIAKYEQAPYVGGPSQLWRKVKVRREGAFHVLGVRIPAIVNTEIAPS